MALVETLEVTVAYIIITAPPPTIPVATTVPPPPPLVQYTVAHEFNLRTSKEANIVATGIRLGLLTGNVINLLHDRLRAMPQVTNCIRLGKLELTALDHVCYS